jgi:hypothetical protein
MSSDSEDAFPVHELASQLRSLYEAAYEPQRWVRTQRIPREQIADLVVRAPSIDGASHGGCVMVAVEEHDKSLGPWAFVTGDGHKADANADLIVNMVRWMPLILDALETAYPKPESFRWRVVTALHAAALDAQQAYAVEWSKERNR